MTSHDAFLPEEKQEKKKKTNTTTSTGSRPGGAPMDLTMEKTKEPN
jgi:hypothetical protein